MYADFTWIIKNTNKNTAKRTPQVSLTICRPRGWPSRSQEQRAERWVAGGLRGAGQEETGGAGRWGRLPLLSEGALLSFSASPTHGFPQCAETAGLFKSVRERERKGGTTWLSGTQTHFLILILTGALAPKCLARNRKRSCPPGKAPVFSSHEPTLWSSLILLLRFASLPNRIICLSLLMRKAF